jgi:hypothetical protein
MRAKTLINFSTTIEKKEAYAKACASLGISISEICRRALDNAVSLSDKLRTPKTLPTGVTDAELNKIRAEKEATQ